METTHSETVLRMERSMIIFTTWLSRLLGLELTEENFGLQMVVRRNLVKGDDELRHLLASQQEVRLGLTIHIHLSIKSIWYQDYIDSSV